MPPKEFHKFHEVFWERFCDSYPHKQLPEIRARRWVEMSQPHHIPVPCGK